MECLVCAGAAPELQNEPCERDGIRGELFGFEYPGDTDLEVRTLKIKHGNRYLVYQLSRLTELESGAVVEIHECLSGAYLFKASGAVPLTEDAVTALFAFLRSAFRLEETRGRKAKATIADVLRVIAAHPKAGLVRLAAELGISTRALQHILKSAGTTLREVKMQSKKKAQK